jgi:hypothetical protein
MKKSRPNINPEKVAQLMFQNRHMCCICHEPRKSVQIHHIDDDPANNEWENLAVLCLDCHSRVTGDEGLGRRYSVQEITLFKSGWEQQCAAFHQQEAAENNSGGDDEAEDEDENDDEEESNEPADSYYEDSVLPSSIHIMRHYRLDSGDEIKYWMKSDEPLDLMIMTTRQYNLWSNGEDANFLQYYESYREVNDSHTVSRSGNYTVIVWNDTNEDADLQLDISIWE